MNEQMGRERGGGRISRRTGEHEMRGTRMASGDASAPMSPRGAKRPGHQTEVIDVQAR
jgi:hypothetical protein